jgi:hypothetical protein
MCVRLYGRLDERAGDPFGETDDHGRHEPFRPSSLLPRGDLRSRWQVDSARRRLLRGPRPSFTSDCLRPLSTFRRGRVATASPRPGTLTLGRIRHQRIRPCGTGEALGSRTADVDLAPKRIAASRLLGTSRRQVVVTGSRSQRGPRPSERGQWRVGHQGLLEPHLHPHSSLGSLSRPFGRTCRDGGAGRRASGGDAAGRTTSRDPGPAPLTRTDSEWGAGERGSLI